MEALGDSDATIGPFSEAEAQVVNSAGTGPALTRRGGDGLSRRDAAEPAATPRQPGTIGARDGTKRWSSPTR
jgi:hypothetical protein